jgi:hypothetical protein
MAATAIAASVRFTARGLTKCYWCSAIANRAAPTRAELNAGTDLSSQLADASGWSVSSEQIATPDLATRYTATIPGGITAEDSSITLYMSKDGVDGRTLMARDAVGYVVWLDGGDTVSYKADVYPVTVSSVSKQRSVQGSEADTIVFSYAITAQPSENVTVPA